MILSATMRVRTADDRDTTGARLDLAQAIAESVAEQLIVTHKLGRGTRVSITKIQCGGNTARERPVITGEFRYNGELLTTCSYSEAELQHL
jgi:hypothetical protein